jgi:WD40 repeat protein
MLNHILRISASVVLMTLAACAASQTAIPTAAPGTQTYTSTVTPPPPATNTPQPTGSPTSTPLPLSATGPWGVVRTDAGIWAFNADGGSLQPLTRDNIVGDIAVSASTGKVAYLADYNPDDPGLEKISLRLISLPDKMVETVTDVMVPLASVATPTPASSSTTPTPDLLVAHGNTYNAVNSLDWSPDGQRLAFVSGRDGLFANVYVYDVRTGAVTRMTDRPHYDYEVKWSPTGEYLFFSEVENFGGAGVSGGSAWVLRADSPESAPIWGIPASNTTPGMDILSWTSPDTFLLEYNTQPCGTSQLSRVDVVTGITQTLWQPAEWGNCIENIVRNPVSGDLLLNQSFINRPRTDIHAALFAYNAEKLKDVNSGDLRTFLFHGSYPGGLNLVGSAAPVSASLPEMLIPLQSPDGNLWAWLPWPTRPMTKGVGLWIGKAAQSPTQIFFSAVDSFSWSPDSKTMFFYASGNMYVARWPDLKPEIMNPRLNSTRYGPSPLNVKWVVSSASAAPPQLPVQTQEFTDLSAAQKSVGFPLWLPAFIPDGLPFYKAWISDYADGSQIASVHYSEPGDPLDANLKRLDIQMTRTDQPLTLDSITHRVKTTAWDVREVRVRGQTGFTYWSPGVAMGNSAHLEWRQGSFNFSISLYGNWPQPDENHPHALDDLLLKIATSLQPGP